jgi:hypothetical protein
MLIAALIAALSGQSKSNAVCPRPYRRTRRRRSGTVALLGFTFSHNSRGVSFSPRFLAVNAVMADTVKVIDQVCHGVVDGAAGQILAVFEFAKAHLFSLEPLLRKSWIYCKKGKLLKSPQAVVNVTDKPDSRK